MAIGLVTASIAAPAAELTIEHVTIVSPERAQPVANATVVIRDDRIAAITTGWRRRAPDETSAVIEGKGLYLTPGLIDSHVHLSDIPGMGFKDEQAHPDLAQAARVQFPLSYLLYGYTTIVDLISTPQIEAVWESASDVRPDTYFCGGVPVMGGYGLPQRMPLADQFKLNPYILVQPGEESKLPAGIDPKDHTPEAVVARMKSDGALCVKMFAEDGFGPAHDIPMIRLDQAQAVIRAAHAAGMPVLMHANAADMQAFAVEAGADIIAHGMWHWDVPPDGPPAPGTVRPAVKKILDDVIARHMGWQPTMQVLYGERDLADPAYLSNPELLKVYPASLLAWYRTPEGQWFHDILVNDMPGVEAKGLSPAATWDVMQKFYARFIGQGANATEYMVQHQAKILFGTDTPSAPTYANPPGLNGFIEMHRLVAAGMTPEQVFRAATLVNADALKLSHEIGTVEVGKRANLLLTREDPTKSVDAYGSIVKVILSGHVLDPAALAANH
jgi:imidazolonepropionase-like amidohydrolase